MSDWVRANELKFTFKCREPKCGKKFKTWVELDKHKEEQHLLRKAVERAREDLAV